jgi:flagellar hook assembly protein FlgD
MQSVQVVIHNILGQRVATLLETELGPGDYEITWDGTGSSGEKQASGVYFYSLSVGERRETKKMVLSK